MNNNPAPRRVLLLMEAPSAFTRRLVGGITSYSQSNGPWVITFHEGGKKTQLSRLNDASTFDGIIARTESDEVHRRITATRLPFVNVSGASISDKIPWVTVNNHSIVRLVIQEFRNIGRTNFAFFGPERKAWGCDREKEFRRQLDSSIEHFHSSFFIKAQQLETSEESNRIKEWLLKLPKPIAILAANDISGYQLLKACYVAELSVPDQVSVIGINNDEVLCELSYPSLTSVSTNTERIGHKAAEVLDLLMYGRKVTAHKFEIEPLGIEPRRSTDHTAGTDPFVGLAFRFIQRHACQGINVDDVLKVVPMSRTALDLAFRQFVGRSLHQEISRIRIERSRQLLLETDLRVADVASRCGFSTVEYFSAAFKREVGHSPTEFRRKRV